MDNEKYNEIMKAVEKFEKESLKQSWELICKRPGRKTASQSFKNFCKRRQEEKQKWQEKSNNRSSEEIKERTKDIIIKEDSIDKDGMTFSLAILKWKNIPEIDNEKRKYKYVITTIISCEEAINDECSRCANVEGLFSQSCYTMPKAERTFNELYNFISTTDIDKIIIEIKKDIEKKIKNSRKWFEKEKEIQQQEYEKHEKELAEYVARRNNKKLKQA